MPVAPGTVYDFKITLQPEDYVFKAGHRIGVVIAATDCSQMIDHCYGGTEPWPAARWR
jgi:X-Pro dipeptidyl-peptidase